jgi:hypothetical protein
LKGNAYLRALPSLALSGIHEYSPRSASRTSASHIHLFARLMLAIEPYPSKPLAISSRDESRQ